MPENDFEKQVKETMGGFKLTPQEPVWKKIEEQLPKQDRRRRFIAFFFLFAGIMVCSYYFYAKLVNDKPHLNSISLTDKETTGQLNNLTKTDNTNTTINLAQTNAAKPQQAIDSAKTASLKKTYFTAVVPKEKTNQPSALQPLYSLNEKKVSFAGTVDSLNNQGNPQVANDMSLGSKNNAGYKTEKPVIEPAKTDTAKEFAILSNPAADLSEKGSLQKNLLKDTSLITAVTAQKESIKIKINKSWQWGIGAFYGRNDIVASFLGINQDKSASAAYSPGMSQGDLSGASTYASKQIKAKTAFFLGVNFKKPLSSKSSFITGLQYTQYSTKIETGSRKDSSARFIFLNAQSAPVTSLASFYTAGTGNAYTNNYQLLQVPLMYEQRLNSSKRVALNWGAGLSITQLLNSNALVYDYANGAFYHNNALYRKTQIDILAGFNIQFAGGKKTTVNIGPQFQYSLSNLLHSHSYGSQHFLSYGIRAGIFFKK